MKLLWNEYNWYGVIKEESGGWAASHFNNLAYFHIRENVCGRNLFLFRIIGPGPWSSGGCTAAAAPAAKTLIDTAVSKGGSSEDIRNYIMNSRI